MTLTTATPIHLGSVELYVVSDGLYRSDGGGPFGLVPRVLWSRHYEPDDQNRIPMALNCLLVRSEGHTILIDTGYGDRLDEKARRLAGLEREGGLVESLALVGVAPDEVDIVIDTHLHGDHCGGNTRHEKGHLAPTFPRARYWMQRREMADARYPNERTAATYFRENFVPLEEAGRVEIMDGDARVTPAVRTIITRGHTRAHQSVIIESQGQTAVFLADVAFLRIHLERINWLPAYDVEPLETLETRRRLRPWLAEREAILFFQHDARTPAGRLRREGEEYRVEPL